MEPALADLPRWLAARLGPPPFAGPTSGPAAAVALLLCPEPDGPAVLLMRRAERAGDRWSGQIGLPGGFYQALDGDLRATARREAREELALDLERDAQLLGALTPRSPLRGGASGLAVLPLVFWSERTPAVELSAEASAAFWMPLGPAARGEIDGEQRLEGPSGELRLPAWRFAGATILGLTHRILRDLIERLPGEPRR
jgi:8-oxo-dGTP pyrophosphatase MutT (NUDIX family)